MTKKTCIDAFKNLSISSKDNELRISPCCLIKEKPVEFLDFKKDPSLNAYRESWLSDDPPTECSMCFKSEEYFGTSRRTASNEWYKNHGQLNEGVELVRLDYWVGDTCNLKCVICGPHFSSTWKKELNLPVADKKVNINKFWVDVDLTHLECIHFNGGEPLLSKDHVLFLESVPNKGCVQIDYNTNGTILPSEKLLELWSKFQLVKLDFSIDDIGERFEYQRYPAKWDQVVENLKWFKHNCPVNCMFGINTTVSVLNHHNLDNLNNWLKENFYENKVGDPVTYNQQLAIGTLSLKEAENSPEKYRKFLDICDERRGTNWRKVFPELK